MASSELSESQAAALQEFTGVCAENGLLDRPPGDDLDDGLTDKTTLLRFLKARSFDVQGALKQFKESTAAHHDNRIAELYDEIEVDAFEAIKEISPHWSGRLNKRGRPIFVYDVVNFKSTLIKSYEKSRGLKQSQANQLSTDAEKTDTTEMAATSLSSSQQSLIYFDYMTRFVFPLCSTSAQKTDNADIEAVTSCVFLVDITTLSLKQVWDLRNYTQDISQLLAINYPEVVDRIYVLNAPSYYSMIWNLIKRFVDPATAAKLVIVSSGQVFQTLSEDIDTENIPKAFGGEFEYQHAMVPSLEERISQSVNWSNPDSIGKIPPGPLKWVRDGNMKKAVAVGRTDDGPRRFDVCSVDLRVDDV